ncbi:MAG: hypothetical protein K6F52_02700 [Clostridia bacterium]|nr:hypothetical protein [Clostridia bacterium]
MKTSVAATRARNTATFIVEIMFRQNSSWQGTIKWVEKQENLYFRSALELIKIIDSTNEAGYQVCFSSNNAEEPALITL